MNPRRVSLWLSVVGGALWLVAAILLVSVSLGEVGTTTIVDGTMVTVSRRTASIMEDSPTVALGWLAATLAFAVAATLLIRYGGIAGAAFVLAAVWMAVAAGILTIGVYLAPGAALFGAAALLAMVDRWATPS